MKKLLPFVIVIIAGALGGAGGVFLKSSSFPSPTDDAATLSEDDTGEEKPQSQDSHDATDDDGHNKKDEKKGHGAKTSNELARVFTFKRQFVVPIIENSRPRMLMILSLNIEIDNSVKDDAYTREPLLRDAILAELLLLASEGTLAAAPTNADALARVKSTLLAPAKQILGDGAIAVLILDIGVQPY